MEFETQLAYYYQFMSDDTCQCKLRQIVVVITSNFDELYYFFLHFAVGCCLVQALFCFRWFVIHNQPKKKKKIVYAACDAQSLPVTRLMCRTSSNPRRTKKGRKKGTDRKPSDPSSTIQLGSRLWNNLIFKPEYYGPPLSSSFSFNESSVFISPGNKMGPSMNGSSTLTTA